MGPARGPVVLAGLRAVLVGLLAAPFPASAAEAVTSFASRVDILPDGRLRVTEAIAVAAEGRTIRRGIYRDFPTVYPHPEPWARALGLGAAWAFPCSAPSATASPRRP